MSASTMATFIELMEQLKTAESAHPFVNTITSWLLDLNRKPEEVDKFLCTSNFKFNALALETLGLPLVYDASITFTDGVTVQKHFDIRPDLPAILRDFYKFSLAKKKED